MAKAQKNKVDEDTQDSGVLVGAAKAIGGLAGKIASAMGAGHSAQDAAAAPRPRRSGKLQKKNKSRLPRRLKKEMKKKAAAVAGLGPSSTS